MKLKSILTFVVAIILSLAISVASGLVFNPIKAEKERQITLSKIQEVFKDAVNFTLNSNEKVGDTEIILSAKVFGKDEKELGYFYEINETNGFGNIRLIVAADVKQSITNVTTVELNQTLLQEQTKTVISSYKGQKLNQIIDWNAAATSVSAHTVMSMFRNLSDHHNEIPHFDSKPEYFEYFGEDYEVIVTNNQTVNGATLVIETISNDLGYAYSLTKDGIYDSSNPGTKKFITLKIFMNKEGKILGAELPSDLYKHTKGDYYNNAVLYANSFKDMNISEIEDAYVGASDISDGQPNNSKKLIHELFNTAKGVYTA